MFNKQQTLLTKIVGFFIVCSVMFCLTQLIAVVVAAPSPNAHVSEPTIATVEPVTVETVSVETFATEAPTEAIEPTIILIEEPILFTELEYTSFYDIALSTEYLDTVLDKTSQLEAAIASAEYSEIAVNSMTAELARINNIIDKLNRDIALYTAWESEYYYAAKTYEFLRQSGFSEAVACGIIGNMMIETSGGTLALNPTIYDPNRAFYGLCQWSLYYRPSVADISFEDQLEYLYSDIEKEFDTFGFCYSRDFTYEDFLLLEDPAEVALAFAKVYERCNSGSYGLRKQAANKAYEYFCSTVE